MLQVPSLDERLAGLAENSGEPPELRLEALRGIVPRRPKPPSSSVEFLIGRLGAESSPVVRLAAVEVLRQTHLTDSQLLKALQAIRGQQLISASMLLPALRESTSVPVATALLDFFAEAIRNGWKPTEQELATAIECLPKAVQVKAEPVRNLLRKNTESQRAKLDKFMPLLGGGNAERGRGVFSGNKVSCSTCHRIGAAGGHVGSDLTKIGAIRSGRDILESILFPSSTIAQGYDGYVVSLTEGRVVSGLIARQSSDVVVLRDSSGGELQLRKSQIREMKRSAISIMPEGLELGLTADEFRDLLAFLQSLR
jgi:putative heme-binding domain-containing protein